MEIKDLESILCGYEKAIELFSIQCDVARRQKKEISWLKSELKKAVELKKIKVIEVNDSIRKWEIEYKGNELRLLKGVYADYLNFCKTNNYTGSNYKTFSKGLRQLGFQFIRKRDGMWVKK